MLALFAPIGQAADGDNATASPDSTPDAATTSDQEPAPAQSTDPTESHDSDDASHQDNADDGSHLNDAASHWEEPPQSDGSGQPYAPRHQGDPYQGGTDSRYQQTDAQPSHHDNPCRDLHESFESKMNALHERHKADWEAFEQRQSEFYASGDRTPEEERAFNEKAQEDEKRLHQKHQNERTQLEREFQDACDGRHKEARAGYEADHQDPNDPCRDLREQTNARFNEMDQRHRTEWRALEDERHAFYATEHTPEQEREFQADMERKEQALKERHEGERRSLENDSHKDCQARDYDRPHEQRGERFEREQKRHAEEYRRTSPETSHSMREMDTLRRECEDRAFERREAFEAEMDAKRDQFEASGSDDWDAFDRQMREAHDAFQREMDALRSACEQKMRAYYEENIHDDLRDGDDYQRMGAWTMDESDGRILLHGKYMSLVGDPTTNTIGEIAIAGQVYIAGIDSDVQLENFDMDDGDTGSTLTATGPGLRLRLHDNPSGVINFQAHSSTVRLELPSTFVVEETQSGYAWANGAARASLRAASANWDEETRTLTLTGQATFLLPDSAQNQLLSKVANKHRTELMAAVDNQRLGAEITIAGNAAGGAADDTIVYDDVEVQVQTPTDATAPVEITVSADAGQTGKTFVLNLDQELFDVRSALDISYFDIDEVTGAETASRIVKAGGLSDILDATDDETAEYWIVLDEDGIQVLVSVPHWSTHRFKVEASDPVVDSQAPGIPAPSFALVSLAVLAAMAYVGRRRP